MSYSSEVVADSPLAYWRLGESSGASMLDSSGAGRAGTYTLVNIPRTSLVPTETDTAADFNGTTAYGAVAHGSWMDVTNITVTAWIKLDTLGAYRTIIGRDSGTGTPRSFMFRVSDTNKLQAVVWLTATGPTVVTGATSLTAGTAYHVALTFDGTTVKLYVNGAVDGSQGLSGALRTGSIPIWVGAGNNGGGGREFLFDGILDEIAYYGSALSATRIAAHYSAGVTSGITGTVAATLPPLSANLSGGIEFAGTITAILPALGANMSGTSLPPGVAGDLSATLPPLGGSLVGAYSDTATLTAILPPLTADLAGTALPPPATGTLAATLPGLSATLAGQAFEPGTSGYLAGVLPALSASFVGDHDPPIGTDLTSDVSLGYNYTGSGDVGDNLTPVAVPAGVTLAPIRRVHMSLPVPVLENGRPT